VPVTDFSMRANAVVREPEIQSYWAQQRVYESLVEDNPGVSAAGAQRQRLASGGPRRGPQGSGSG
jgi:isoleucyl-tRNA synthetase